MEGAVERVRPKMITVTAFMAERLSMMWGKGTGPEVVSCIDTPMLGGMISSTVPTLGVIPAHDALVKPWELRRTLRHAAAAPAEVRLAASGAE